MRKHAAPIIAATLLLLPALYVGSYLALVEPAPLLFQDQSMYRTGGLYADWFYWPLEQIDRQIRPDVWEPSLIER